MQQLKIIVTEINNARAFACGTKLEVTHKVQRLTKLSTFISGKEDGQN